MNYFSIPTDFQIETIDRYAALNQKYEDKIMEVYGQINSEENEFGSGRPSDQLPALKMPQLKKYISYLKKAGIHFNYTLNTTCLSNREFTREGQQAIISFLYRLIDAGVSSVTVCMPSLIEIIHDLKLPLQIKASTVSGVINCEKARAYRELGVSRLVTDESINRDFAVLRQIVPVFPENVELIVNVICDMNCIYRPFHHNQMSHDYQYQTKSASYYSHRCSMRRAQKPENILKMNFIRPEDLGCYEELGIHHYKIQGRQAIHNGDILKTTEAYMRKQYEGDLLTLLDCFSPTNSFRIKIDNKKLDGFLKPFLQDGFCRRDCSSCNYCQTFCQQYLPFEDIDRMNQMARNFYSGTDEFKMSLTEKNGK